MRGTYGAWVLFASMLGSCRSAGPAADLVLRGGRIFTSDTDRPRAEAIAIQGETIQAIGSNREVTRFIGRETVVLELADRLVLHGFHDCGVDLLRGSLRLQTASLDEAVSIRDVQDLVLAHAEAHPELAWVVGAGWQKTRFERAPDRHDLDEVVSDRPVVLESRDGQSFWVNSMALQLSGIVGEAASGIVDDEAGVAGVRRALPSPSRENLLDTLRRGIAYAHRFGVTAVRTDVDDLDYPLLTELETRGELMLRVDALFSVTGETTDAELDRISEFRDRRRGPYLRTTAVRIALDGDTETRATALLAPRRTETTTPEQPRFTCEELVRLLDGLHKRGLGTVLRTRGEAAVRLALEAYEKRAALGAGESRPGCIEGMARFVKDDISRMSGGAITACLQPMHASPEGVPLQRRNLGSSRLGPVSPFQSLAVAGVGFVFGSGWPRFDLDPMLGIHAAVTRQNLDGNPEGGWCPDERLPLEDALIAYTRGISSRRYADGTPGALRAGAPADIVVLSEDLFRIPPRRIGEVEAVMTLVGGRVVYVSPSFGSPAARERLLPRH